jgi:ABC transporter substrate binding protein (PQQ-dependent alcohol dehydrogenase system)
MRCSAAWFFWALLAAFACEPAYTESAPDEQALATVAIVYLSKDYAAPARTSLLDPVVADYGWRGAEFGVQEIGINGRFVGKRYELIKLAVPSDGDLKQAARTALAAGHLLIVADLQAADLLSVADLPEAKNAIILDARTSDDSLRQRDCRSNVFHILPNWAMRADALGQYLARKNWKRWFLLSGVTPADGAYAAAVKRAAARVGATIVAEKSYQYKALEAEGNRQIQLQIPAVTHISSAYDVIFVVDTSDAFGEYLLFNTWAPRLIAGTQGLVAVAWHPLFREYAARGLQYRFHLVASRDMTERDYGNWLAISIIGEAVTRGGATDAAGIRSYLLSDQFSAPAFKGEGVTFRRWDHQIRQPILLFGPKMMVSMWPQEEAHHSKLLTDTLGYDQPETACRMAQ